MSAWEVVAVALSGLALAGVVFVAFGSAAMVKLIRELEERLNETGTGVDRRVEAFAGRGYTFVLVGQQGCLACADRSGDLAQLVTSGGHRPADLAFTFVQADGDRCPVELPAEIRFARDAVLVGQLGVGIFPTAP